MSLQSLLKIGQLDEHTTDAAQIGKMLDAAESLLQHVREWLADNTPGLIQ